MYYTWCFFPIFSRTFDDHFEDGTRHGFGGGQTPIDEFVPGKDIDRADGTTMGRRFFNRVVGCHGFLMV